MKNLYDISKGQLITVWIFAGFGWLYTLDGYSDLNSFLAVFIPFALVFYTIGWKNSRNK